MRDSFGDGNGGYYLELDGVSYTSGTAGVYLESKYSTIAEAKVLNNACTFTNAALFEVTSAWSPEPSSVKVRVILFVPLGVQAAVSASVLKATTAEVRDGSRSKACRTGVAATDDNSRNAACTSDAVASNARAVVV